jgi:3-dehydroquinate dehydratase/shikimate dehydrogenase
MAEGGFAGAPAERRARLLAAAARYDLVDLECERDLEPELLASLPAARQLISRHGGAATAAELRARCDRMTATAARLYRLAVPARAAADGLVPLELLRSLRRPDLTAFATGPAGSWTRLLASRLGAPVVFGRVEERICPRRPTAPSASRGRSTTTACRPPPCAGCTASSATDPAPSPRLHNAAYRRLRLPALYPPFQTESLAASWRD